MKANHYSNIETYDSKERFVSYWHQINEIKACKPKTILEIGMGNGFVTDYLKKWKFNVTTLDISKDLKADYTGSVTKLPFENNSFDVISCCEVLEHLPFEQSLIGLKELHRVAKKKVILSLPDYNKAIKFGFNLPKTKFFTKIISYPYFFKKPAIFDGQHYWEIGKTEFSLKKLLFLMEKTGFKIIKTYRVFDCPYWRFFILQKEKVKLRPKTITEKEDEIKSWW